jgi:hypothetical protein
VYAIASECGAERPELDKGAAAASWRKVGAEVRAQDWTLGDVVVIRTGRYSWSRHVGFFVRAEGARIWVLGGNQGNRVDIRPYSVDQVDAVRRLGASERGMLETCSESATDSSIA